MSLSHEIYFPQNIEEVFGHYAKGFGLGILINYLEKEGIPTDRPLDKEFSEAARQTNSGLLLKADLLPCDVFYIREKGFEVTRAPEMTPKGS